MISEIEIVIRLLVASLLGGLVGFERERHNQPAGLRTHVVLTIGSTLAMCISINLSGELGQFAPNGDPARLAAQVITGIGFLGAGAIIRFGPNIKGLTTATSLWTVAIVGLAVGAGHFFSAVSATAFLLGALVLLDKIEKKMIVGVSTRTITITNHDRPNYLEEIKSILKSLDIETKSLSLQKDTTTNEITVKIIAKIRNQQNIDRVIQTLSHIDGCKKFGIE